MPTQTLIRLVIRAILHGQMPIGKVLIYTIMDIRLLLIITILIFLCTICSHTILTSILLDIHLTHITHRRHRHPGQQLLLLIPALLPIVFGENSIRRMYEVVDHDPFPPPDPCHPHQDRTAIILVRDQEHPCKEADPSKKMKTTKAPNLT